MPASKKIKLIPEVFSSKEAKFNLKPKTEPELTIYSKDRINNIQVKLFKPRSSKKKLQYLMRRILTVNLFPYLNLDVSIWMLR